MNLTTLQTPLKLQGVGGDLQQFDSDEIDYLSYRGGLGLSTLVNTAVSRINSTGSAPDAIGTYDDTQFDNAIGSTILTTTTTTTTLYQNSGTASYVDSDGFRRPLAFETGGGFNAKEMADSDLNVLVDEVNSRIHLYEYPGTYKLASSTPGVDYTAALSNVFTDNRTDGTTVNYSIWKRTAMTAPTTTKYLRIKGIYKDETDLDQSYDGFQEATDDQISNTIASVAQNRIMTTGIGTAQLRSSAEGAPTDPGTWVAKGTAVDTKQQTADVNYSRDSTRNSTTDFNLDYQINYDTAYEAIFEGNYESQFSAVYTGTYDSQFSAVYTGTYDSQFSAVYTGTYDSQFSAVYTGTYDALFSEVYTGTYTLDYIVSYILTYESEVDYVGDYLRAVSFTTDYTADAPYVRAYARNISYLTAYGRNYQRNYTAGATYLGNYVRLEYGRVYQAPAAFAGQPPGYYLAVYIRTDYIRNYIRIPTAYYARTYGRNYTRLYTVTLYYEADYIPTYAGNYAAGTYSGNYVGTAGFENPGAVFTVYYQRDFSTSFTGTYEGNFETAFTGNYDANFETAFTGNYDANFETEFTGNYDTNFINDTNVADYVNSYTTDYTNTYTGDFIGNYIGEYAGETIDAASETIETYTLYIRIS